MSVKQTRICDRCGQEIPDDCKYLEIAVLKSSFTIGSTRTKEYDLCKKCRDEFVEFMKEGNDEGE